MAASLAALPSMVNILPGMNAGASTYAVPSPIKGSGTAWVLLGSWALSPARPTPIHPRHECRGLSALFGDLLRHAVAADRLGQESLRRLLITLCCQQEINGLARLIHGTIEVIPLASG